MTSAQFTLVPIASIIVDRDSRQRRELTGIEELAASIQTVGLINPPVITRDGVLVAGERRLTACRSLGWDQIPIQWVDEIDPVALTLLELEENVKRVDLSWVDQNNAVAYYHALRRSQDPEWNATQTAEALNTTPASISRHLMVAEERKRDPELEKLPVMSTAISAAQKRVERRRTATVAEIDPPQTEGRKAQLIHADFLSWTPDRKYNFVHCDFPYGVSIGSKSNIGSMGNKGGLGSYEDSGSDYWTLLNSFLDRQDTFIADDAHIMFWFSMKFHKETVTLFEQYGWSVHVNPLIWVKSDNSGIIPNARRDPRHIYETALLCWRGDRPLLIATADAHYGPTSRVFHAAEKPRPMLAHFFRLFVDETTTMLDPTCGSGNAVAVAETMGAANATGVEKGLDFFAGAKQNLNL